MVIVFERSNALFIFNFHPTKRCPAIALADYSVRS
jgi:hypothetical protein